MWTKSNKSAEHDRRNYQREVFRSEVVSLFWNIFAYRKKHSGLTQSALAGKIGVNKSAPSRWFSGEKPNWEENTMVDIADALDVELEIFARDRETGQRFAPYGPVSPSVFQTQVQATGTAPKSSSLISEGEHRAPRSTPRGPQLYAMTN